MKNIVLLFAFVLGGCNTLSEAVKDLAGTKKAGPRPSSPAAPAVPEDSYSKNKNYQAYPLPERQYGRMDRNRFEKEAKVAADAGSLWVDEGQGSYLFSQNQRRLEGDVLNVKIEDQAQDQLNQKVNVIADLLKQREMVAQKRQAASEAEEGKAETQAAAPSETAKDKKAEVIIDQVPTRVVAAYPDGSYRVKGTKNIMIGNREFQVLVSGLAKGGDIAEDAIGSGKLLDAKFDIITNRRVQ